MNRRSGAQTTPRRTPHRSRAVLAGAVLTYLGTGLLLVFGVSLLLAVRDGTYLGQASPEVSLAGIPIPIHAAPAVGALLIVLALTLVALTVLTQRGHRAGRPGLTVIGVIAIGWLLYAAVTNDPVSPFPSAVWIALALILFWVGRTRETRT